MKKKKKRKKKERKKKKKRRKRKKRRIEKEKEKKHNGEAGRKVISVVQVHENDRDDINRNVTTVNKSVEIYNR